MAFSQVVPQDSDKRKNKPALSDTVLMRRDGTLIGPELPRNKAWSAQTREWWDMWRRHEIAPKLEPSDWMHLLDTALLHSAYWDGSLKPSEMISSAAEIRRRVASFGATLEDRLKLRIKFAEPENKGSVHPNSGVAVDYSQMMED